MALNTRPRYNVYDNNTRFSARAFNRIPRVYIIPKLIKKKKKRKTIPLHNTYTYNTISYTFRCRMCLSTALGIRNIDSFSVFRNALLQGTNDVTISIPSHSDIQIDISRNFEIIILNNHAKNSCAIATHYK